MSGKYVVAEDANGRRRLIRSPRIGRNLEGEMLFLEGTATPSAVLLMLVQSDMSGDIARMHVTERTVWTGMRLAAFETSFWKPIWSDKLEASVRTTYPSVLSSSGET